MTRALKPAIAALLAGVALVIAGAPAFARDHVDWSINLSAPLAFAPPPVAYPAPAVVYSPPRRVYVEPVQIVEYNRHFHGYREHAWRERERREYYYRHHYRPLHEHYYGGWNR